MCLIFGEEIWKRFCGNPLRGRWSDQGLSGRPILDLDLDPRKHFQEGEPLLHQQCHEQWAPHLKLDANFTDKFMETKFSQEKYALLGNFHQIPPEYLNICPTFFHSFSFCGICLWTDFKQEYAIYCRYLFQTWSGAVSVLSYSLLTVSGVPGVCWPPGPAWKEFKSAFEVKAGLVILRQRCNLETGHAQTNPPCDPAGRGWEASRWKLVDPHAYLEQVGALHRPRGHCYLALMILWGPLRLVSGPRC